MRIISKFHDYYDTAMGFGVDNTLIYKRIDEPGEIVEFPRWMHGVEEHQCRVGYNPSDLVTIKSWVVPLVFCGKLYMRAIAYVTYRNPKLTTGSYAPVYVTDRYTGESRKDVLARIFTEHRLSEVSEQKYRSHWHYRDRGITFDDVVENQDWIPVHIKNDCPVFLIRSLTVDEDRDYSHPQYERNMCSYRIQKNPMLKNLGFFQVKQPFEAYQELSMFLGGVMGSSGNPTIELSDKEVHQKHGFDKWSFRKMPQVSK